MARQQCPLQIADSGKRNWQIFINVCVQCMEVVQSIGVLLVARFRELKLQKMDLRS
jgi:hypothetical protein